MNQRFLLVMMLFILGIKYSIAQVTLADSAVSMNTAVDNNLLCPDKKEIYLYIDLKACNASKRLPLNIAIVLDRSGSMEDEGRLHNAKLALCYLIDHLQENDICSIIIYDHIAEVIHGASRVTDKEHLKRKINHINPRGHTNIGMGLQLGYEQVKSSYGYDKINRVILLSDGLANEGITDDYLLEMMVSEHSRRDGISVSTFGLGHEFNEKLMHNIAEYGGGNYYFIERSEDAINDFITEVKLLNGIVAKNGLLKITYPSSKLKISHVFGFPYTTKNDEIIIDLKEVHPNEKHGVLIKFYINNLTEDSLNLSTALNYQNVLNNQAISKTQRLVLSKSNNSTDCHSTINEDVFDKIVFFSSNYYLDSAVDHAEKGDLRSAHETINSAKKLHEDPSHKNASDSSNAQYQLLNEYQAELEKHKDASPQKWKLLHKRIRHKNYKLRKITNKCP